MALSRFHAFAQEREFLQVACSGSAIVGMRLRAIHSKAFAHAIHPPNRASHHESR
jgi:hypothetical protein